VILEGLKAEATNLLYHQAERGVLSRVEVLPEALN
jgi:hypothetical protein